MKNAHHGRIRSGRVGQTTFEYFPETQPTCLPTTMAFQPFAAVATKSKVAPGLTIVSFSVSLHLQPTA